MPKQAATRYNRYSQMEVESGASDLCKVFASGKPFFIGRNGTIEIEAVFFWIFHRKTQQPSPYPDYIRTQISINAGIFPNTDESIDRWCYAYTESLRELDGLAAGWYKPLEKVEKAIIDTHTDASAFRCPLRSLEPYYVPPHLRWTQYLSGKRVAVVSSFVSSIRKQLYGEKMAAIWTGDRSNMITDPTVEWSFVRTGYSPYLAGDKGRWPSAVTSWEKAVEHVVEEVVASKAQIALVGCGGLGMVIGGELRRRGVSVLVLGGAIQVLFGLKGRRWASHSIISTFWNDAWKWPDEDEVPKGAVLVERGCYWG